MSTDLTPRTPDYTAQVRALVITNDDEYRRLAELREGIRALRAKNEEDRRPGIKKAYETHKQLMADFNTIDGPLDTAERLCKTKLGDFDEKKKRESAAEALRIEQEARKRDEDARLAHAVALEQTAHQTGDASFAAAAEEVLAAPTVHTPAPVVGAPKVSGLVFRWKYGGRLVSLKTVIEEVAAGRQPIAYLTLDQSVVDKTAGALKEAFACPGIELTKVKV